MILTCLVIDLTGEIWRVREHQGHLKGFFDVAKRIVFSYVPEEDKQSLMLLFTCQKEKQVRRVKRKARSDLWFSTAKTSRLRAMQSCSQGGQGSRAGALRLQSSASA